MRAQGNALCPGAVATVFSGAFIIDSPPSGLEEDNYSRSTTLQH